MQFKFNNLSDNIPISIQGVLTIFCFDFLLNQLTPLRVEKLHYCSLNETYQIFRQDSKVKNSTEHLFYEGIPVYSMRRYTVDEWSYCSIRFSYKIRIVVYMIRNPKIPLFDSTYTERFTVSWLVNTEEQRKRLS